MSISKVPQNNSGFDWDEKSVWDLHFQNIDILGSLLHGLYKDRTVEYSLLPNQIFQLLVDALAYLENLLEFEKAFQSKKEGIHELTCNGIQSKFTKDTIQIFIKSKFDKTKAYTKPTSLPSEIQAPYISRQVDGMLWEEIWKKELINYREWSQKIRKEREGKVFPTKENLNQHMQVALSKKVAVNLHIGWLNAHAGKTKTGIEVPIIPPISYHPGLRQFFWKAEKVGKRLRQNSLLSIVMSLMIREDSVIDLHHRKITYEQLAKEKNADGKFVITQTHSQPADFKDDVREWNGRFKKYFKDNVFHQDGNGIGMWIGE